MISFFISCQILYGIIVRKTCNKIGDCNKEGLNCIIYSEFYLHWKLHETSHLGQKNYFGHLLKCIWWAYQPKTKKISTKRMGQWNKRGHKTTSAKSSKTDKRIDKINVFFVDKYMQGTFQIYEVVNINVIITTIIEIIIIIPRRCTITLTIHNSHDAT